MRIGIPEGLLFRRYEPFIRGFFNRLGVETVYSGPSSQKTLERGIKVCVDEACLPMKIFHGQVSILQETCDQVAVLRLMKCEFGESVCPKFAGLPELVQSGTGTGIRAGSGIGAGALAFTSPLYMNDKNRFKRSLVRDGEALGIPRRSLETAFHLAYSDFFGREKNAPEEEVFLPARKEREDDRPLVVLLGHPYNTLDPFVNMDLLRKLKALGIAVIHGEEVPRMHSESQFNGLIKKPYWLFFRDNYGAAGVLSDSCAVDGIIYVSSFCCGTDSFTVEMIKNKIGDLPMLVLKLDEHTGEAGVNTRLEAFAELLERRRRLETHISKVR